MDFHFKKNNYSGYDVLLDKEDQKAIGAVVKRGDKSWAALSAFTPPTAVESVFPTRKQAAEYLYSVRPEATASLDDACCGEGPCEGCQTPAPSSAVVEEAAQEAFEEITTKAHAVSSFFKRLFRK